MKGKMLKQAGIWYLEASMMVSTSQGRQHPGPVTTSSWNTGTRRGNSRNILDTVLEDPDFQEGYQSRD